MTPSLFIIFIFGFILIWFILLVLAKKTPFWLLNIFGMKYYDKVWKWKYKHIRKRF